jgi:hypothetical protein
VRAVTRTIAVVSRHLRCLLAVAVLVIPVALVAPDFVRGEVHRANGDLSVFAPPPAVHYNEALIIGVVAHVPSHASLATVGAQLGTARMRWVAYVIAPRQLTNARAQWTMVFGETPQEAHLDSVRSWRYGADWLVEH